MSSSKWRCPTERRRKQILLRRHQNHRRERREMQSLRRSAQRLGLFARRSHRRALSAQPHYAHHDHPEDQVLVNGRASSRVAILNRPSALNALNSSMVSRLTRLYESWEESPDIGFVFMKGSGRAFCSGGDALALSHLIDEGNIEECRKFFETLYKYVYLQGTYLKPHVAIMDGISMGSGAGMAIPGMFRLVTDKTVFRHPEAQLGFHPDAGASFYLSRLPGYLGEYLALTGDKLDGVEMIACGLATHYVLNARLSMLEERLGKLVTDDAATIEKTLAHYGDLVYPNQRSIIRKIDLIDKCFCHDTVEEIIHAIESDAADSYDEWHKTTLQRLREASPISLKVTLRSIREGRFETADQCLAREYRISLGITSQVVSKDFSEGVRARLADKDFAPKWGPSNLGEVTEDMVDYYFTPLEESESELKLPTALREPYV